MHLDPTSPASAPDSGSVLSLANQAPPASVDAASVNAPNPAIDAEAATVTASTDTATKSEPALRIPSPLLIMHRSPSKAQGRAWVNDADPAEESEARVRCAGG